MVEAATSQQYATVTSQEQQTYVISVHAVWPHPFNSLVFDMLLE